MKFNELTPKIEGVMTRTTQMVVKNGRNIY